MTHAEHRHAFEPTAFAEDVVLLRFDVDQADRARRHYQGLQDAVDYKPHSFFAERVEKEKKRSSGIIFGRGVSISNFEGSFAPKHTLRIRLRSCGELGHILNTNAFLHLDAAEHAYYTPRPASDVEKYFILGNGNLTHDSANSGVFHRVDASTINLERRFKLISRYVSFDAIPKVESTRGGGDVSPHCEVPERLGNAANARKGFNSLKQSG